jgi:hypothetical protein
LCGGHVAEDLVPGRWPTTGRCCGLSRLRAEIPRPEESFRLGIATTRSATESHSSDFAEPKAQASAPVGVSRATRKKAGEPLDHSASSASVMHQASGGTIVATGCRTRIARYLIPRPYLLHSRTVLTSTRFSEHGQAGSVHFWTWSLAGRERRVRPVIQNVMGKMFFGPRLLSAPW